MSLDTRTNRFDEVIDRRGTDCLKWDGMQSRYSVAPEDGISMWVADMDFRPPEGVANALADMQAGGVYGYPLGEGAYLDAISWWMSERHGWEIPREGVFSTHGLVNGTAMCIDAFTEPGDGVVLFTPVYHAFARVITAAERRLVEVPLAQEAGRYILDLDAAEMAMTGGERLLIWCAPHNPGGRVWTQAEMDAIAAFAEKHDLILVSDEIHHDLVYPGQNHIPFAHIDGVGDRLVMMTAATKTFGIAGAHIGNVIIADPALRARFAARMAGLGISPGSFGLAMATAAYSPEGAAWVDDLMQYLEGNRDAFEKGVNSIPGLRAMPLEATYLAWVDFSNTGMTRKEFTGRVEGAARIAANHGPTFGTGGDSFLRFNLGTRRAVVDDAVARLKAAFADLQ